MNYLRDQPPMHLVLLNLDSLSQIEQPNEPLILVQLNTKSSTVDVSALMSLDSDLSAGKKKIDLSSLMNLDSDLSEESKKRDLALFKKIFSD